MKILHFADLHLGVETYGRIDPATGLSSRLEDFLKRSTRWWTMPSRTRLTLSSSAAMPIRAASPPRPSSGSSPRRINRLSTSGIPIFLLIGNHDLPNAIGKATTTEIFDTLAVKNVYVSNRPEVYRIPTTSGIVQIVSLPWLRRSALLSKEDTKNLTFEQINQRLQAGADRALSPPKPRSSTRNCPPYWRPMSG